MKGFGSDKRKDEYIASRILAKRCVADFSASSHADWQIERSRNGAPVLSSSNGKSGDLRISISHSEDYCAVAVSTQAVGVDVQFNQSTERWCRLRKTVFSHEELARIDGLPADSQAIAYGEIWALKEARAKFTEKGLQIRSDRNTSFVLADDDNNKTPITVGDYQALTVNLDSHTLAVYSDVLPELANYEEMRSLPHKRWRVVTDA